jgi:hypothetical protein
LPRACELSPTERTEKPIYRAFQWAVLGSNQ